MKYYAHSARYGKPSQIYEAHIEGVMKLAYIYAKNAAQYGKKDGALLVSHVTDSSEYHDVGKLESNNQINLSKTQDLPSTNTRTHNLPYHHQDAGVAYFMSDDNFNWLAASAISAHHIGYRNHSAEENREALIFRDIDDSVREVTKQKIDKMLATHQSLLGIKPKSVFNSPSGDHSVYRRLLLSCLADADHTDTAIHYGKLKDDSKAVELLATERLAALDEYVSNLVAEDVERKQLRDKMYLASRKSNASASICYCDSPVGSGKTLAIMAHLMRQAERRGLRRIFVVLPYTNIIQQSVNEYRKALVLLGENPYDVVAELHHRADFESLDSRHLSALWRAPIVVTTAVAFFETLASNAPAVLRRLHELPGSAVFIDESHAALPVKLLPLAWRWMNTYADEWGCYWLLASGSFCRFWNIKEIAMNSEARDVPNIINNELQKELSNYETKRISYKNNLIPKSIDEMVKWVKNLPGPKLVILNTVQNAAVLAKMYAARYGRECTEHLSTALMPIDREKTLARVIQRLEDKNDVDWVLFATSCVEAGMHLSFRNGFRELGTLLSLLQAAGRINREGVFTCSEIWSFIFQDDARLTKNPELFDAIRVLKNYIDRNIQIGPELSTEAIANEIRQHGLERVYKKLLVHECNMDFQSLSDGFTVVESNTKLTVFDKDIVDQIKSDKINWQYLQKYSTHISYSKLKAYNALEIVGGIYHWNLPYDDFIGYMAGII